MVGVRLVRTILRRATVAAAVVAYLASVAVTAAGGICISPEGEISASCCADRGTGTEGDSPTCCCDEAPSAQSSCCGSEQDPDAACIDVPASHDPEAPSPSPPSPDAPAAADVVAAQQALPDTDAVAAVRSRAGPEPPPPRFARHGAFHPRC